MEHFVRGAGAEEAGAIAGESEAVKGFRDALAGGDCAGGDVEDDDLVGAVAAVEHSGEFAAGVEGDIDREISGGELLAGGAELPLIREEDGAVRERAGQLTRGLFRRSRKDGN